MTEACLVGKVKRADQPSGFRLVSNEIARDPVTKASASKGRG